MSEPAYWIFGAAALVVTLGLLAAVFVVFSMSGLVSLRLVGATTVAFMAAASFFGKASYMRTQRVLSDRADRM